MQYSAFKTETYNSLVSIIVNLSINCYIDLLKLLNIYIRNVVLIILVFIVSHLVVRNYILKMLFSCTCCCAIFY